MAINRKHLTITFSLVILVLVIILPIYFIVQRAWTQRTHPQSTNLPGKTASMGQLNWKTYKSSGYEISYPDGYIFYENQVTTPDGVLVVTPGTDQIVSPILPDLSTNFVITINRKGSTESELGSAIKAASSCNDTKTSPGREYSTAHAVGLIFTNTSCDDLGSTVVYFLNSHVLYELAVDTPSNYDEVKQYAEDVIATLKFGSAKESINEPQMICPESGWADCMPGPDKDMSMCSKEALNWYEANCENFQGPAY